MPIHDDGDCYRYTDFVLILLGDPGMQMWRGEPGRLEGAVDVQGARATVTVTDRYGSAPVAGASVTAQVGATLAAGVTGEDGKVVLTLPSNATEGGVTFTVAAPDYRPLEIGAIE